VRLKREDFEAKGGKRDNRAGDAWFVCEEYELREIEEHKYPYPATPGRYIPYHIVPKYGTEQPERWREYFPLKDTPSLCLSFARLYERKYSVEPVMDFDPILNWVHEHGLLGISTYWTGEERERGDVLLFNFEESIQWFLGEASKAHTLLRMYEAVLGRDAAAATAAMDFTALPSYAVDYWVEYVDVSEAQDPVQRALETALLWTQKEAKCQRTLLTGDDPSDPTQVKVGWSFRTLLGAMYQQMFWLVSSRGNVTRCKFCGELVELSVPQEDRRADGSKRRKPPQHKVFCNRSCQQSHYYHTKVKPRRLGDQKT
jgi:hypothetical protein